MALPGRTRASTSSAHRRTLPSESSDICTPGWDRVRTGTVLRADIARCGRTADRAASPCLPPWLIPSPGNEQQSFRPQNSAISKRRLGVLFPSAHLSAEACWVPCLNDASPSLSAELRAESDSCAKKKHTHTRTYIQRERAKQCLLSECDVRTSTDSCEPSQPHRICCSSCLVALPPLLFVCS